ncbi:MAG TPA: 1-(5-phosphoribosyl)-5-[(5-phosphoribosylamino)methylideneamino]imidazole-4-carboxamide isomerase [Patescibacteria group bacterium]|nr:1-(5-phosphoribosyl)-5-[(5-phosphoribosylamino)methylideneamino]imidazole-4-carboxamide isomerase [Patescibacteria group bacterium]
MQIIPAIDIRNGRCVRLTQGDFDKETVYSDDPITVAMQWEQQGASILHVVDLDGAKDGDPKNFEIIESIVQAVDIPVQVGGGIRTKATVAHLRDAGVNRVVLATLALEDKIVLNSIINDFADHIAVSLDTKNGKLMKQGWLTDSGDHIIETAKVLEQMGIRRFIYTDITKDGTMTEPNFEEIKKLLNTLSVPIIVSGGIATEEQIQKLKALKTEGVILGKALYEKKLDFKELLTI